ncbi:MAG: 3-deoxy-7-phosphoheptulonate synthase [Gemmatimonadota bacterium]
MIVVTEPTATAAQVEHICERIEELGLRPHISRGEHLTIIGCIGEEARRYAAVLRAIPGVARVLSVEKRYKLASREFAAADTVVQVGTAAMGGAAVQVIAGPCSVEGRQMILETAAAARRAGAGLLRGGAFKPRTSPYSFRGLREEGLEFLAEARERTGLPVVTEVLDTRHVELVARYADVLQIGARNMQNFALLSLVGEAELPVLLKRGLSATTQDLLLAAEYVLERGNSAVMLCERGIRTFETGTRNTFDLNAIPLLKRETHLPVVADPSHATGDRELVAPVAFAAVSAGADAIMVEVHPDPERALSDGDQSLTFEGFERLMTRLAAFAAASGRSLAGAPGPSTAGA